MQLKDPRPIFKGRGGYIVRFCVFLVFPGFNGFKDIILILNGKFKYNGFKLNTNYLFVVHTVCLEQLYCCVCAPYSSLCTLVQEQTCRWLTLDKPAGDLRVPFILTNESTSNITRLIRVDQSKSVTWKEFGIWNSERES